MDSKVKSRKRLKVLLISVSALILLLILPKAIYKAETLYERYATKKYNEFWLSRISLINDEDFPVIEWEEDTETSKGMKSFLLLDRNSEEVKNIVHTKWPLDFSMYYWWKSRFGGDYFFTQEQTQEPDYQYELTDSTLHILTSDAPDTWIYLPAVDPQPGCYALDFDYCPIGNQYETLQIDVRMKTLANRFKFVIRYNKDIKFDMCIQSNFLSSSSDERWLDFIKPLTLNQEAYSHIRVEMIDDYYSFIVNGERVLNIKVEDSGSFGQYWCLMSWNTFQGGEACEMGIRNFRILHSKQ